MSLLIHSMSEFSDLIVDCLERADVRNIAEIGSEFGGMSQHLHAFAAAAGGTLTSIDPSPKPEFLEWVGRTDGVRHVAAASLDAMPVLADVDAWVIDGDHNYYTVLHELKAADDVGRRSGKPLLAFLHDVGWPNARRDMYYAPERIPEEFCHPHDYDDGATLDQDALVPGGGFRGCGQFALARRQGGPRNGVLTAIEDFVDDQRSRGRPLAFARIPGVFGLGILFDSDASWSGAVALAVEPFHNNRLLETLERNRLENYLQVIALQDSANVA